MRARTASRLIGVDVTNDSNDAEDEFPAGRNIGCCRLAAATEGRQHFPVCVNGRDPRG